MQKAVSIGAHGCDTTQGKHNGVLVNLKRKAFHYMLPTSCAAHKANLACEVIDSVPSCSYLCRLVKDTQNHFSNSPKRTAKLAERFQVCHAFHSFCRGLPAIWNYLHEEQHKEHEAKDLFGKLSDFTTL